MVRGDGQTRGGQGVEHGKAFTSLGPRAATSGGTADDGKHGDAAMLGLDGAEAVEALLVSIVESQGSQGEPAPISVRSSS